MCVAFWSLEHPDYALILCTNRDEYLSRPTENAHFHSFARGAGDSQPENGSYVLSGRDLQAGGTWFGINRAGRVALITNITEPTATYAASRGFLVSSFLSPGAPDWDRFLENTTGTDGLQYAGFNLLLLDPAKCGEHLVSYNGALVTNSGGGGVITWRPLSPEERHVGGLSNGIDLHGGGDWPKVHSGQAFLEKILASATSNSSEEELIASLFELLTWRSESAPTHRAELRNSIQIPPFRMSSSLAPDAVHDGDDYYGTRLSTVVLVRRDGGVVFIERDIWQLDAEEQPCRGDPRDERVFRFTLASGAPGGVNAT